MSSLVLQQIMTSRYRTSIEAHEITVSLMTHLGLSTKANVVRLALGRSLALGALGNDAVDAKGMEIPAAILFTQDDIFAWVGLIVMHAREHSDSPVNSMDLFREAVRRHWHRGAKLLQEDWNASFGNFDKFLETLIFRRADLPDVAKTVATQRGTTVSGNGAIPLDASKELVKALAEIGVRAEVRGVTHGPRVTRYNVYLLDVNQFDKLRKGLERLAISLNLQKTLPLLSQGSEARTVNLDVPRAQDSWKSVSAKQFREWLQDSTVKSTGLMVFPGVDVMGEPYSFDLSTAPHLLVGGTTGSGKSVCLHAIIVSLIGRLPPEKVQLALIDPKQVEFSVYKSSKYLYRGEIATTAAAAKDMLQELVSEMEARYQIFSAAGAANIDEARSKNIDMPYICAFIEELADLLFMDRDIEDYIVRIAQKARAAGIHLVLATQRPDAKTFSGLVRSNIPARIALTVQKSTESNIILDEGGAEDLLGAGDMLVKAKPGSRPERVHGVRLDRSDIESILASKR